MRVALVSEAVPPQRNGVVMTLMRLVAHLSDRGHAVLLVGPRYRENAGRPWIVDVPAVPLVPFYPEVKVTLPLWGRALAELDRFEPDLVHVASPGPLGFAAVRHARRLGYPPVSSYHTDLSGYTLSYARHHLGRLALSAWRHVIAPTVWRYVRRFHNATHRTYCPTPAVMAELAAHGVTGLELWPRGVDTAHFTPARRSGRLRARYGFAPRDIVVLYVGRLAKEKELDRLFEAMSALRPLAPRLRLLVVGDGPDRQRIVRRYGGAGVAFAGYQTGTALAEHYASADCFAFPSRTETFGNAVQEAMASGLPVAAVAAGGVRDVVCDGVTGLLADPDDSSAFARAIGRLVSDASLRRRLGQAGRAAACRATWGTVLDRLLESYAAVVEEARAGLRPGGAPPPRSPAGGPARGEAPLDRAAGATGNGA